MGWPKEIERLRAENARLRVEGSELFATNGELANTLAAENQRLRAALTELLAFHEGGLIPTVDALERAEAALTGH